MSGIDPRWIQGVYDNGFDAGKKAGEKEERERLMTIVCSRCGSELDDDFLHHPEPIAECIEEPWAGITRAEFLWETGDEEKPG